MTERMPCSITDGPQYGDPELLPRVERDEDPYELRELPPVDAPDLRNIDQLVRYVNIIQRRINARRWLRERGL